MPESSKVIKPNIFARTFHQLGNSETTKVIRISIKKKQPLGMVHNHNLLLAILTGFY